MACSGQLPWLVVDNFVQENQEMPSNVQAPILDKLNQFETDAPHSWDEAPYTTATRVAKTNQEKKQEPRNSVSIHTLEELEAKLAPKPEKELKKTEPIRTGQLRKVEVVSKPESRVGTEPVIESGAGGAVREGKGREAYEDPLSGFEEKSPPSGANSVVLYTTSLRGVRKTFEDCTRVKTIFELHHVIFYERDVSLHGEFVNELRDLTGEGMSVPRVFIKGRYIGGVDEVVELNESARLGRILVWARVERVEGRQACEGCGAARFVPCLECGGSCKVLVDGVKERDRRNKDNKATYKRKWGCSKRRIQWIIQHFTHSTLSCIGVEDNGVGTSTKPLV
ncbi:hypothetical protein Peur_003589 [Populus x canadensis]